MNRHRGFLRQVERAAAEGSPVIGLAVAALSGALMMLLLAVAVSWL